MNKTDELAHQMRISRFQTYPSGGTARSLAVNMIFDLQRILQCIPENEDVPPWVLMLMSESANSVHHVQNFITYYGTNQSK